MNIETLREEVQMELNILREMTELLAMKDELSKIKSIGELYKNYVALVTNNDDSLSTKLEAFIEDKTFEDIDNLSDEEKNNLLEGKELMGPGEGEEYLPKFLKYLIDQRESMKSINSDYDSLLATILEETTRLKGLLGESDISEILISNLIKQKQIMELTEVPEKEALLYAMESKIDILKDAVTFNSVYELFTRVNPKNTLDDFKNVSRRNGIIKSYTNTLKHLGMKSTLIGFNNLEKEFLPEEYHDKNNLFIFVLMKYISKSPRNKSELGLIISQQAVLMQALFTDTIKEEKKERVLNDIKKVLDLF